MKTTKYCKLYTIKLFLTGCIYSLAINTYAQKDTVIQYPDSIAQQKDTDVVLSTTDTIVIAAVGDVMLGTNYPDNSYLPPDSGKTLLSSVSSILQCSDLAFGNLEGCILKGSGTVKKCKDPKKCYAFRQPEYMSKRLVEAGFDVLSVANNHVSDFGEEGRASTVAVLRNWNIHFAGLSTCPFDTFTVGGIRYGFTAFSVNTGTNKIQDYHLLDGIVKHLDSIADVIIVSFHGGGEGRDYRHVPRKTETYIGEDRGNVYQFAHRAIDNGADLIIGHGPHVPRALDVYKDRLIMYSLGNFCTYHRFSLEGQAGLAPLMEIKIDHQGKFISGQIHSFKQIGEGGPIPDEQKRALRSIKELTLIDFPEVPLKFTDDGLFLIK